jgi:hypothetical protein
MGLISEGSSGPSPPGGGGGISSTSDKVEPVPVSGNFTPPENTNGLKKAVLQGGK